MANHPRTRKRVRAIISRRSPDGSAFQKCDICCETVAIALADMHECGANKKELKRFKGITGTQNVVTPIVPRLPRSPFNIFMESFTKTNKNGNSIDIDRKGFETWKFMSKEERQPYVTRAGELDSAYKKDLIEEEKKITVVGDDEADSAMVGKFDEFYEYCLYYETSDSDDDNDDELYQSGGFVSLTTSEWEMQQFSTREQR